MNRQQVRKLILLTSLLLFPITMNYLSPYLIVNGAFEGVLAGSAIMFISLFLFSMFTGRLFCGWICPMGGLNESLIGVNGKRITSKGVKRIKFFIWGIWFVSIFGGFLFAGGLKGINMFYMTDKGISVDEPLKYIIYYFVILLFAVISILVGRRASCHTVCWIAPFMIFGKRISYLLKLPRYKVQATKEQCIHCNKCTQACPMSIDVMQESDVEFSKNDDCILCGRCIDSCPKKCFSFQWKN